MKKRSEVMKKRSEATSEDRPKKKSSAAERTVPLFEDADLFGSKSKKVMCESCDEESAIEELTTRADGDRECPHCGAPIDTSKLSTSSSKAGEKKKRVPEPEEDEEEEKPSTKLPKKGGLNTSASGIYCAECGTEWPIIHGEKFPNCGHVNNEGVDSPSKAKQLNPPPGHPRPNVKRVRVVYGEQMFRVADYSTFRTPTVELEAEVKQGEDYTMIEERLYQDAKRMADKAFKEIYESYMQKLGFMRADLSNRK